MEIKILEVEAREILSGYTGANNQILEWQYKLLNTKGFKLARTQAIYVRTYHKIVPKVVRKYVELVQSFSETLAIQKELKTPPKKIWVEKLLCDSEKAYHIWGKINDNDKLTGMWIPKAAILQEEKKLNRVIDYTPYSKRPPMEHQKVAIEKLLANDRFILADDMGVGKGLCINELVYSPKGKVEIGTLKIGDKVIGTDGKAHNVIGVFPQGIKDVYKITFNDGFSIVTDEDHLWTVNSRNNGFNANNERNKLNEIVLSTKQLLDKEGIIEVLGKGYNSKKKYTIKTYYVESNGNLKWQIPIVKPIEFDRNDELPIEPYLLGLSLGDGSFNKNGVRFSVHKDDYDEMFYGINLTEHKSSRNLRVGYINLKESIEELNLSECRSHNKFIPEIYKYSSIENRISLLQGLMDTDGFCVKSKGKNFNGVFYCTVSEKLCDDIIEIVHSLGGVARKSSKIPKFTYKGVKKEGKKAFNVNIKLPEGIIPFRLKRKSDLYNTPNKYKVGRYIKKIEFYGQSETVCISVDSPDKLYVANYAIVTHNTTSAVIASLESNAKKVLIVCPASLKINWKREIEIYTKKKVLIVEGRKWGSTFDYYIINYDILKNFHTTDKNEDSEAYQLIVNEKFDLAIVDECFTYDSKVMTEYGEMNIGDIVENGLDVKIVSYNIDTNKVELKNILRWIKKHKDTIYQIKLSNGIFIECTDNHKFFTKNRGYVKAKELRYDDNLYLLPETINEETNNQKRGLLQQKLCFNNNEQKKTKKNIRIQFLQKMSQLWENNELYHRKKDEKKKLLLKKLCKSNGSSKSRNENKMERIDAKTQYVRKNENHTQKQPTISEKIIRQNENTQSNVQSRIYRKNEKKIDRKNISFKRWTREVNRTTKTTFKIIRKWMGTRISSKNEECKRYVQEFTARISSRYWQRKNENSNRNRWKDAQIKEMEIFGQEKNRNIEFVRVESIKVLERGSYDQSTTVYSKNTRVYDLEIEDNHNYFVNKVLVSNCHYISNTTAQRTKLLNDILSKIPKVWLLTGTPMTSRPINYFNLLKIVNSPLSLNWQHYVKRYCKGYKFKVNGRTIWNTSGASNLDELRERSKNLVLRRMKTDILDLPDKIITPIFLELNSSFYNEELDDFIKISESMKGDESITVTINRLMKIRQIIAIEKIPYTCELIDKFLEQDKKVIVFTNFTMSLDMLHEKYKKQSVVLDGRMSKDKRQISVDRFQNDPKIKIFISNIKAGGVGINLTEAEGVIMNDLSFVPSDHSQAEDRAFRYGQKNNVLVYYPIFENTVELIIYNILQRKKNIIDQVMGDGEYSESLTKELLKEIL